MAALFVLFHQRICGPLKPPAKIEVAYHEADAAIQKLVDLIAASGALAMPSNRPANSSYAS